MVWEMERRNALCLIHFFATDATAGARSALSEFHDLLEREQAMKGEQSIKLFGELKEKAANKSPGPIDLEARKATTINTPESIDWLSGFLVDCEAKACSYVTR